MVGRLDGDSAAALGTAGCWGLHSQGNVATRATANIPVQAPAALGCGAPRGEQAEGKVPWPAGETGCFLHADPPLRSQDGMFSSHD